MVLNFKFYLPFVLRMAVCSPLDDLQGSSQKGLERDKDIKQYTSCMHHSHCTLIGGSTK